MSWRVKATVSVLSALLLLQTTPAMARCMAKVNGRIFFGDGNCSDYHFSRCIDIAIINSEPADLLPVENCGAGNCVAKTDVPCETAGQLVKSKTGLNCKVELLSKRKMKAVSISKVK